MNFFVIAGMPAAGKNIARTYTESKGFVYDAAGDIVRTEVKRRGLEADAVRICPLDTAIRKVAATR